jgi:ribonuclease HI
MRVTIISDASHCHQHGIGGYAFWAVSTRGHHAGDGVFKSALKDSTAAETMAIVNALHCSISLGIVCNGDQVLIQTDCVNAISYLQEAVRRKRADLEPAVSVFKRLKSTHALAVEFRHVRGHTKVADQRSKAQRSADIRARRAMRQARDKVTAQRRGTEP